MTGKYSSARVVPWDGKGNRYAVRIDPSTHEETYLVRYSPNEKPHYGKWTGTEWEESVAAFDAFYDDVWFDDLTEAEAREKFPEAFAS